MNHLYRVFGAAALVMFVLSVASAQQAIDPANYITVDNPGGLPQGGTANTAEYKEIGPWFNGTSSSAWGGNYRQTSQLGGEVIAGRSATWTASVPPGKAGIYLIYNYVLQAANNASNVYYTVQREFENTILDSVRHDLRRSAWNLNVAVGPGTWVPIMIDTLNVGNVFLTVGADSSSGSAIMRADGMRMLRSVSTGADLEFGRRAQNTFDTVRVGESWPDSPLGVVTYREIPLYNLGAADLVVTSVYTSFLPNRWDIKLQNDQMFPLVIKPGQKKNIVVGFRPFQEETITDTLVIVSNDSLELNAKIPVGGTGINYNFILNASRTNEPHYNAPFDKLGDSRRPQVTFTGTWNPSGTGISSFPYPIAGGNLQGTFSSDAVCGIEYRFQLPDSVNGKPGSSGFYFIEHGAIPFTSNSENNAQVAIASAFSIDTFFTSYNQSGLTVPPFFYPFGNKPIQLNQGDFNKVSISREVATAAVLRADLLRIRKIPTGPTVAATPQLNFGSVSIYEQDRNSQDNYRLDLEINSGGESALRVDSVVIVNPRRYSLLNAPSFPALLPAVNGSLKIKVAFIPDTIANGLNTTIRVYTNDTAKSPWNVIVTGNGVGTGLLIEEIDALGSYMFPQTSVTFPDLANMSKWQKNTSAGLSGGSNLLGYIYHLETDPTSKTSYVEYFPQVPTLAGHGPELDTFNVFVQMPIGSSNSSPAAKYTIFPAAGGTPIEQVITQNGRSGRAFLGAAVFLRSNSRDGHGGGAINGYVRVDNDTLLVNAYYKDSLINRAKQDSFVLRADAIILQETLTGVEYRILPNVPNVYSLSQNYPNPFNPTTKINFGLPQADEVQLTIYDVLGREVRTLVNERYDAGAYSVQWDGKNNVGRQVATGMYIYRLHAGTFVSTKKMLFVK
jgi:hypothetical protein